MWMPDGWWVTPATIKAVIIDDGRVLLAHNPRNEWELPGGRPDHGETSVAQTLVREILEETGLLVRPGRLLLADLFEVVPGAVLMVVVFEAHADGDPAALLVSDEHSELAWFPLDALPSPLPPIYATAISAASPR